jgi:hypothetical protein
MNQSQTRPRLLSDSEVLAQLRRKAALVKVGQAPCGVCGAFTAQGCTDCEKPLCTHCECDCANASFFDYHDFEIPRESQWR